MVFRATNFKNRFPFFTFVIMQFKDIAGQHDVKQRLIQSVTENRIAHAQLFFGPEGAGELALAIAYAQYINCSARTPDDSCGVCPSCSKYQKLIHPDLHFVYPVATNKAITKDPVSDDFITHWRSMVLETPYFNLLQWYEKIEIENKQGIISKNESEAIIRKLGLKSFEAEYKVMIIWMAERMNDSSANKLLKMIEEPPEKTLFLLLCENMGAIIPTILSRTQLIKVPKISAPDMHSWLAQRYSPEEQLLTDAVKLSNGNMITAIGALAANAENSFNFDNFIALMRLCWKKDVLGLMKWCEGLTGLGREQQKNFLSYAQRMVRENYVMNCKAPELALLTKAEQEFSNNFFPFINQNNILSITDELNKAQYHIEANANDRIVFLDMALKLIKLIKM
jgi:DNA polymerase-3 subunit delta'